MSPTAITCTTASTAANGGKQFALKMMNDFVVNYDLLSGLSKQPVNSGGFNGRD